MDGLVEKIGRARCAVVSGPVRVVLTVVVCDPASLEVVRRRKKTKTDRIDARKMVRALRARDGGDRDALAPVRVSSVEEEDAKRLLRRQGTSGERTDADHEYGRRAAPAARRIL